MKGIILLAAIAIFFIGCSNSNQNPAPISNQPEEKQVVITNDMENAAAVIPSWINERTVVKMENGSAHSGEYVAMVNDVDIYSYTYREYLENISQKLPKRVVVNGWVNSPDPANGLSIILDINENNVTKIWKSFSLKSTIEAPDKWFEFTGYFAIDKPIQPSYQVKVYAYSGKKLAYFDDLKITFEY